MAKTQIDKALLESLAGMDEAYVSGNKKWFDYLADNIVVYSNNSGEPYKGKSSYFEHFGKYLIGTKRKMDILNRDIQMMGEVAVMSQTVQIVQDDVVVNIKQSQVWESTNVGWRVNHIHSAIIGNPQAIQPNSKKITAINVINEKIASMASVVGVAQ